MNICACTFLICELHTSSKLVSNQEFGKGNFQFQKCMEFSSEQFPLRLMEGMAKLREKGTFTDVTIQSSLSQGTSFKVSFWCMDLIPYRQYMMQFPLGFIKQKRSFPTHEGNCPKISLSL